MGGYAIVRLLLPMCPNMYNDYGAFGSVLGYMSVINTSLIIVTEPDLKRLIAYFSIVHMNISIIGLFAGEKLAILGAIGMMVSHSLIASALFFCIGVLYERYQTRDTTYYGGLANASINFAIVFFLFILSNFSFPLTFGFWPEVLVLTGLALVSYLDVIVILISSIFSLASNLILYTRVFFSIPSRFITKYADLTRFEMFLLCPLMIFNIYYGVHPQAYLIFIDLPVNFLLTACSITL
jgi:NADH-quinone oxidoreductase subunit M